MKEEAKLCLVEPKKVAKEWPMLSEQLLADPTLWEHRYTLDGIYAGLRRNTLQLWLVKVGDKRYVWGLTDVWTRAGDDKKMLTLWWARGEHLMENLPPLVERFVEIAKAGGYFAATVSGRKGWERAMGRLGFRFLRVEMVRELED